MSNKREFHVDDRVTVSLIAGSVVEATVKAIINRTDGRRLQVDYGKSETALVYLWQVEAGQKLVRTFRLFLLT